MACLAYIMNMIEVSRCFRPMVQQMDSSSSSYGQFSILCSPLPRDRQVPSTMPFRWYLYYQWSQAREHQCIDYVAGFGRSLDYCNTWNTDGVLVYELCTSGAYRSG
jgi:hypothetical protein